MGRTGPYPMDFPRDSTVQTMQSQDLAKDRTLTSLRAKLDLHDHTDRMKHKDPRLP